MPELSGRLRPVGRVAILVSRYNEAVTSRLLEGALACTDAAQIPRGDVDVIWVAGAFELPVAAAAAARTGRYACLVALGVVIRGETPHFEYVADHPDSFYGLGRTGYPFYFAALGLKPHLVAIGKALGGGVPVGAALINDEVAKTIAFGDHGSTYGGNLLACRAALVFLDELVNGGVLAHVRQVSAYLDAKLAGLKARHPKIVALRGAGLMCGIDIGEDAAWVVPAALAKGLLVNRTSMSVVRLLPPYVITERDVDEAIAILSEVLA